jgi:hypothetical protein
MNSQLPIQGDTLDAIRSGPPPLVSGSNRRGSQSSKSSAGSPTANEKKSLPDQQFDVDPENQSDKVGSVRREDAEMDAAERRRFTIKLWAKRAWLAVFFLLMTASVSNATRFPQAGSAFLGESRQNEANNLTGGGSSVSSSVATPRAWDG